MPRRPMFIVAGVALGATLLVLDAAVARALVSLGWGGMREIGGWGMLTMGIIVTALAAANLLMIIIVLYRRAVRGAELSSEPSP